MLISGKGKYFHVFGCISKNFSENIFWCLEKKKEKTNPRKISSTIAIRDRDLAINGASSRRRDLSIDASRDRTGAISRSMRREIASLIAISVEGEIAINCAISRWREIAPSIARSRSRRDSAVDRDLGRRQDRDQLRDLAMARDRAVDREIAISCRSSDWRSAPRARLLSLSLSLSLSFSRNALKWKWGEKIISESKVKILVNRKSFFGKYYFPWQPNMRKMVKMISWNHFHPKQTHPKWRFNAEHTLMMHSD